MARAFLAVLFALLQSVRLVACEYRANEVAQEKFLGGLANIIRLEKETVTMTEQATLTTTLTSVFRKTETAVDYRTKTLNNKITLINTIWATSCIDVTRYSTLTEIAQTTTTEEVTLYLTSTLTEDIDVQLNVHITTSLFAPRMAFMTAYQTRTVVNTQSQLRTTYDSQTIYATQTLTVDDVQRVTSWGTISMISLVTFEEHIRLARIKTVTRTRTAGLETTVTLTETVLGKNWIYGRIPANFD